MCCCSLTRYPSDSSAHPATGPPQPVEWSTAEARRGGRAQDGVAPAQSSLCARDRIAAGHMMFRIDAEHVNEYHRPS
jgi:hypothetical protein